MVPRHMPDELLQTLAFLVMKVGDQFQANALSRFKRPCINWGETSAWASICSSRSS